MRRTATGNIHGTNCPCGIRIPPNTVHECDVDRIAELETDLNALRKLYESRSESIAELEDENAALNEHIHTSPDWQRAEQAEAALAKALQWASSATDMYDRWVAELKLREQAEATIEAKRRTIETLVQDRRVERRLVSHLVNRAGEAEAALARERTDHATTTSLLIKAEATIERLMKILDDSGIGTPVEIAEHWAERGGE